MVVQFIQSMVASESGNATPLTTSGMTTTSGGLLVAGITFDSGTLNTITGVTDSKGNTWTKALELDATVLVSLWYTANIIGGSAHTFTVAYDDSVGDAVSCIVQEFSGIATASPLDKTVVATGTSAAPNSGATAATTQADELVIGFAGYFGTNVLAAAGSGYGDLAQSNQTNANGAMESKLVSATGAQTAAFTLASSRDWACICATFKTAAGGGGGANPAAARGFLGFF